MTHTKGFLVPPMGEALDAARIVNWNIQAGQRFSEGDVLLEIETDKSVIEVPAAENGKLLEQLVAVGETFNADAPVAMVEVEGDAPPAQASPQGTAPLADAGQAAAATPAAEPSEYVPAAHEAASAKRLMATPVARKTAADMGIVLSAVIGTGPAGRVTKADVLAVSGAQIQPGLGGMDAMGASAGRRGPEEMTVSTAYGDLYACRWHASRASAAPTVVLVHGLFGDIDTWAGTIAAATRAGLGVVAVELPCHGRSASLAAGLGDIAAAVAEAIAQLCHGPVVLAGHSLGAAIAVKVARQSSLRVAAAILFAPLGCGTEINQSFLDGMVYARSDAALERELAKLTAVRSIPSITYLRKLGQRLNDRAGELAALCREISCNGVQQLDIVPDIESLSCPVALVHGRSDIIIPWRHALNVPARVALHLIPKAGHMPQAEAAVLAGEIISRCSTYKAN